MVKVYLVEAVCGCDFYVVCGECEVGCVCVPVVAESVVADIGELSDRSFCAVEECDVVCCDGCSWSDCF